MQLTVDDTAEMTRLSRAADRLVRAAPQLHKNGSLAYPTCGENILRRSESHENIFIFITLKVIVDRSETSVKR
jgi:hypothetical protein